MPLEIEGRLIHDGTPRLAKQVSSKYGNMSAAKVRRDLSENHQRDLSRDYIQNLAQKVGSIIEEEEIQINYKLPPQAIGAVSYTHLTLPTTPYV